MNYYILPTFVLDLEDFLNTFFGARNGKQKDLVLLLKVPTISNWRTFMPPLVNVLSPIMVICTIKLNVCYRIYQSELSDIRHHGS